MIRQQILPSDYKPTPSHHFRFHHVIQAIAAPPPRAPNDHSGLGTALSASALGPLLSAPRTAVQRGPFKRLVKAEPALLGSEKIQSAFTSCG